VPDRNPHEQLILCDVESRIAENAPHDPLPVLPNRSTFLDRVGRCLEHAKRHTDHLFAVLFVDMDRFKVVSESLGHAFGDQLLVEIAGRLQRCIRRADSIARFGGDKYLILLEGLNHTADAIRVVGRIRKELLPPINQSGNEIFTSACIGIAMIAKGYRDAEDLLRDAETALHRAKKQGPGTFAIFDPTMHEQAMRTLRMETELRRAIDRRELILHYQPIVSIATRKITGFEALVRWQHPERGLVRPAEFLPVAEETDLIIPISDWAIHKACKQLAAWRAQFPDKLLPSVSVNLTGRYFSKEDLLATITGVICEHKLEPSDLVVEITENQIMENPETASKILRDLSDFGTKVSIDDFGTGYSSLSYLANFPIHALKIDQSFIARLNGDSKNLSIVRSIISLGQNLGLEVIAEGVETETQLEHLRRLQCQYAQGYYFSKPLEAELIARFIARLPG